MEVCKSQLTFILLLDFLKSLISSNFKSTVNSLFTIQQQLRLMKPDLAAKYHVSELGLFGSVVRDDFTSQSDIDIMVDFSRPIGIEFIDLADELESKLNRKVDLVSKKGIKPKYFDAIQSELIYV